MQIDILYRQSTGTTYNYTSITLIEIGTEAIMIEGEGGIAYTVGQGRNKEINRGRVKKNITRNISLPKLT
jgi:hypothetical protein